MVPVRCILYLRRPQSRGGGEPSAREVATTRADRVVTITTSVLIRSGGARVAGQRGRCTRSLAQRKSERYTAWKRAVIQHQEVFEPKVSCFVGHVAIYLVPRPTHVALLVHIRFVRTTTRDPVQQDCLFQQEHLPTCPLPRQSSRASRSHARSKLDSGHHV